MRKREIESRSFKVAKGGYVEDANAWKVPGGAVYVLSEEAVVEHEIEDDRRLKVGTLLAYNGTTEVWSEYDNIADTMCGAAHAILGYGWRTLHGGESDQLTAAMAQLGADHERILAGAHYDPEERDAVVTSLRATSAMFGKPRNAEKENAQRRFKVAADLLDAIGRGPNPGASAATLVGARGNVSRRIDDSQLKELGLTRREIGLMTIMHECRTLFRQWKSTLQGHVKYVEKNAHRWFNGHEQTRDSANFAMRLRRFAREVHESNFPRPFVRHQRYGVTNLMYAAACLGEMAIAPGCTYKPESRKPNNARDVLVMLLNGIEHMELRQEIEHVRRVLMNGEVTPRTMAGTLGSLIKMAHELEDDGFANPVRGQAVGLLAGGFAPALTGDQGAVRDQLKLAARLL